MECRPTNRIDRPPPRTVAGIMSQSEQHALYQRATRSKAAALAKVTAGMSREDVETVLSWFAADLGKGAQKSLRVAYYAKAGLGHPSDYHDRTNHITTDARGTTSHAKFNSTTALSREECEARGLPVGPGNK